MRREQISKINKTTSTILGRMYFILKSVMVFFWGLLFFFSLLHLFSFKFPVDISSLTAGYLVWSTFFLTIIVLGWNQLCKNFFIFFFFSFLGFLSGSYLEPPADPLDHLNDSYQRCEDTISSVKRTNSGLWQYGMNAALLCRDKPVNSSSSYLQRVDILNGILYGLGATILFLVARSAGFSDRWAIMSIVTAMLFFGTNVFSYFRYYSFAPSYSSICIYWLWIARFFFRKGWRNICLGLFAVVVALPILIVNHLQEAIFLLFIAVIWLWIFLTEMFFNSAGNQEDETVRKGVEEKKRKRKTTIFCYILVNIFIIFILPQSFEFREMLSSFFIHDYWTQNQDVVFKINDWHLIGRIWVSGYRVIDTLGVSGFLPLILVPLFILEYRKLDVSDNRVRILVLGLIPFLIYCLPLFNYIWLSNCVRKPTHLRYYYRFCYAALAWLPIIYVVVILEYRLQQHRLYCGISSTSKRYLQIFFLSIVFSAFLFVSSIRTFPFYGKLDFYRLDSKPWWPKWKIGIEELFARGKGEVLTDPITGMVIRGVFGRPAVIPRGKNNQQLLLVEEMDEQCGPRQKMIFPAPLILLLSNVSNESRTELYDILTSYATTEKRRNTNIFNFSENEYPRHCLVNIRGFSYSWVPSESRHWNPGISKTKWFYRYHNTHVAGLEQELRKYPPQNCIVLY